MKTKKILSAVIVIMMMLTFMSPAVSAVSFDESVISVNDTYLTSKADYVLASGITESYFTTNNGEGSNQVQCYAIEVDLNDDTTSIIASYKDYDAGTWGMQKVRDQAHAAELKLGVNVVAGVNGDFYDMTNGAPKGTFVMNGVTYTKNKNWNYFAILNDGTPVIGSGYIDTSTVRECVGGPSVILKDGELTEDAKTSSYGLTQLPRTAVGITADGKVVFVVSDGRQSPASCGQTFIQLAETMLAMGCVDALSLDGGGSATLISQRAGEDELACRNTSADCMERTVSTSILICSTSDNDSLEQSVSEHEHDYTYSDPYVTCNACGNKLNVNSGYTGFATDSESGALMYFINGNAVTGWFSMHEDNYYFNADGLAQTGKVVLNGRTYQFGNDYKMTKGALVKESGYYFYYINGIRQRGWHMFDGYWHYFDVQGMSVTGIPSFAMATGTWKVSRKDSTENIVCTFDSNGRLISGGWAESEYGTSYYWGYNPVSGLYEIDNALYYFDPANNFYMVTNASAEVNGTVYAFDSVGKFIHYGEHSDSDENGKCDICETINPVTIFIEKLTSFITKVHSFFSELL